MRNARACMRVNKWHVPILHVVPSYPGAHVHVNMLIPSMHVAQLWQGFEMHSLKSEMRNPYCSNISPNVNLFAGQFRMKSSSGVKLNKHLKLLNNYWKCHRVHQQWHQNYNKVPCIPLSLGWIYLNNKVIDTPTRKPTSINRKRLSVSLVYS